MSDTSAQPSSLKKKPGRPRKALAIVGDPKGIVSAPVNKDSCMELVFVHITLIKSLFNMFSSMVIKNMIFTFTPEDIEIFLNDEHDNMNVTVSIKGEKVFSYFCKETFIAPVYDSEINQLLKNVEKNYWTKIMFRSLTSTKNSTLKVVLERDALKMTDVHPIRISKQNSTNNPLKVKGKPKLEFTLPAEDFKLMIAKVKKFSDDQLVIERHGDKPLIFIFKTKMGLRKNTRLFRDDEKISLISTLDKDELFTASIKINTIQPFSSVQLCSKVIWRFYENSIFTLSGKIKPDVKAASSPEIMDITISLKCLT